MSSVSDSKTDIDTNFGQDERWFYCSILLILAMVFNQITRAMEARKTQKLKKLKKLNKLATQQKEAEKPNVVMTIEDE